LLVGLINKSDDDDGDDAGVCWVGAAAETCDRLPPCGAVPVAHY